MTLLRFRNLQHICSVLANFSTCHFFIILKKLWLETFSRTEIISRSKGISVYQICLSSEMPLFPSSSKEEPENQPLVNCICLVSSEVGVGILFISHQKNTKEGLKREGLGRRSVWDLASGLVVMATRMTSNTFLTTRLSQACSQQLAPFSLSTALGRVWVGKARNPSVLTSNTTPVFPSPGGTLEFSEEFVSSLQEILSQLGVMHSQRTVFAKLPECFWCVFGVMSLCPVKLGVWAGLVGRVPVSFMAGALVSEFLVRGENRRPGF